MRIFKSGTSSLCIIIPTNIVKEKTLFAGDDCEWKKDAYGRYYLIMPEDRQREIELETKMQNKLLRKEMRKKVELKIKDTEKDRVGDNIA